MPDEHDVKRVAADLLHERGPQAVEWLIEQAETAEAIADEEAARTWREIAAAAEAMLRGRSG